MTRPVKDTDFLKILESFRALAVHPEFTDELAAAIRKGGGADRAVGALLLAFGLAGRNPYEISVEETLERLRRANGEQGWGIAEDAIAALAETAPEWPGGRFAFRSLRIRWGEGDEGVALTFERHVARIKQAFVETDFWRWEYLRSDREHLRLLAGNASHRPAVEWVTFDLDANRERESVAAVRGLKSLADEGLAFAWLFRGAMYHYKLSFFLAGYELDVPEHDGVSWRYVPVVDYDFASGKVRLRAHRFSDDISNCSVPSARE